MRSIASFSISGLGSITMRKWRISFFYYKKHTYKTRAMQEFMKLIYEKTEEN